jgi:CheY-like chemotaxis protein
MTPAPLRVLMVDDHPIVLAGLRALVEAEPDFQVIGKAGDGRNALRLAKQLLPDIVVLDISMPEMNGIEVATALLAERLQCRVLVLTVHEDRAYLRQLVEAGVSGYLLKRSASDELIRALHAVTSGGMYLDPAIAREGGRADFPGFAPSRTRSGSGTQRTGGRCPAPGRRRAQQQGNIGAAEHQCEDGRDLQGPRHGQTRLPQPRRGRPLRRRAGMAARELTRCVGEFTDTVGIITFIRSARSRRLTADLSGFLTEPN